MGDELVQFRGCTSATELCAIEIPNEATTQWAVNGKPCRPDQNRDGYQCGNVHLPRGLLHTVSYLPGPQRGLLTTTPAGIKQQIYLPATDPRLRAMWRQRLLKQAARSLEQEWRSFGWPSPSHFSPVTPWIELVRVTGDRAWIDRVEEIIARLEDPGDRALEYVGLAERLAEDQRWSAKVREILQKAEQAFRSDPGTSAERKKDCILFASAGIMAAAGDLDGALAKVQPITDREVKENVVRWSVEALLYAQRFDEALARAQTIGDDAERWRALHTIARDLAAAGQVERASAVVATRPDEAHAVTLGKAMWLAKQGAVERAMALAREVNSYGPYATEGALSAIAGVLIETRQFDQVFTVLEQLPDEPCYRVGLLEQIAERATAPIPRDRALGTIINNLRGAWAEMTIYPDASAALVRGLARGGYYAYAIEWVADMNSFANDLGWGFRGIALATIAMEIGRKAGDQPPARPLVQHPRIMIDM